MDYSIRIQPPIDKQLICPGGGGGGGGGTFRIGDSSTARLYLKLAYLYKNE